MNQQSADDLAALESHHFSVWNLTVDGDPFRTRYAHLRPVRRDGAPAMLKIVPAGSEEADGAATLEYFGGIGAVRLLEDDVQAQLMERASSGRSLTDMVRRGEDDEATRILCAVAAQLHGPRTNLRPPTLVPLERRFRSLFELADKPSGAPPALASPLPDAAQIARDLLARPGDETVLHGDVHHANVLVDKTRGWLAIDPKGLFGERAYDYANILCNPDIEDVARSLERLMRQAKIIAKAANLDLRRLLAFTFVHAVLSAAWSLEDGEDPSRAIDIAVILRSQSVNLGAL
ncbi:MAG: aminoglycoside phosphotransferase family protein [Rhodospirillaceae bacterium]